MEDVLSSLRLVDINQLDLHEEHEPSRLNRTSEAIKKDGFLRHPVLAVPMKNGRYMVLDGVHRISALRLLGGKRVPLQVVDKTDFLWGTWDHQVACGDWLEELFHFPNICCSKAGVTGTGKGVPLAEIVSDNGQSIFIFLKNHDDLLHVWHKIVSAYSKNGAVLRLPHGIRFVPEKGKVLVKYQDIGFSWVEQAVMQGCVLPAGVTRCQVNGRLLNLKIPLHFVLEEGCDQQSWNCHVEGWKRSIRLYTEQVYLCEV